MNGPCAHGASLASTLNAKSGTRFQALAEMVTDIESANVRNVMNKDLKEYGIILDTDNTEPFEDNIMIDIKPSLRTRTILLGDVIERLEDIPSYIFDSIVTSVPFFGVRDYGIDGQWGLEKDVGMYLDRMNILMDKLYRVLKPDGTAWIEIGDKRINNSWYGIPETFFVNARQRGWKSISKPIWYKRNAFPLSSKNMFSPKYTNIYGFAKNDHRYFDLDSVKVPPKTPSKPFNVRIRDTNKGKFLQKETRREKSRKQDNTKGIDGKPLQHYKGFNHRYDHNKIAKQGKNPGDFIDMDCDVFDITVKSLKDIEHYATFPPELAERLIKVSCPEGGLVLDPFMGAGTTGLVAETFGRNWIGIELKEEFAQYAINRIGLGQIG